MPPKIIKQYKRLSCNLEVAQKYKQHSKKWNRLTDTITTYCIGKDVLPIYTVEKAGVINLLRQFDPQYELPGRKYFIKATLRNYITYKAICASCCEKN